MPPKVERCVDAVLKRKNFKPNASKKERESAAWAICQAAQKQSKNEYTTEILHELPPDVIVELDAEGMIRLSIDETCTFEEMPFEEVDYDSSDSFIWSKKDSGKVVTMSEVSFASREKKDDTEEGEEDEDMVEIEILREGKFAHWLYGDLDFNKKYFLKVIENFLNDTVQREVSFDSTHKPWEGATSWVKKLGIKRRKFRDNKIKHVLTAVSKLTKWGKELLEGERFKYFSSEVDHDYEDAETQQTFGPTLLGGGLTNRPFITGMQAAQLSEDVQEESQATGNGEPAATGDTTSNSNDEKEVGPQTEPEELSQEQQTIHAEVDTTELAKKEEKKERPPDSKLPDAAFALVKKDSSGKVVRALPHHGPGAKSPTDNSSVDIGRLRNALARINQVKGFSKSEISGAQSHLDAHARVLLKTRKEEASKASTDQGVFEMNELKEKIAELEGRIASLNEGDVELRTALEDQLSFLQKQEQAWTAKLEETREGIKTEYNAKFEEQKAQFEAQNKHLERLEANVAKFEDERYANSINTTCDKLIKDGKHFPSAVEVARKMALSVDRESGFTVKLSTDDGEQSFDFMGAVAKIFEALPEEARVDESENLSHDKRSSADGDKGEKAGGGEDKPSTVKFEDGTEIDLLDQNRIDAIYKKTKGAGEPAN